MVNAEPPTDLLSKHVWNATTMPSWEDTNLVNIVTDYGATPENVNGTDDDQDNIQNAINFAIANNKTVFIPRGHFHIGSSLNFPSGLKIIGSSKTFSIIQQKSDVLTTAPLIQSEDNASGGLVMSDFGILTFPYRTMLNIRTNNTIFRDILTEIVWTAKNCYNATYCGAYKNGPTRPYMLFSGNAGGKIFGIVADQLMVPTGNPPTHNVADFNLVKVSTQQPLEFHQFSIEHIDNSPQVQINSAKDVTIYGFKFEGTFELLNIFNSKNINLIGGSGNYGLEDTSSRGIIYVDNTSINILMQNLCRKSWGTIDYANTTGFWVKGDGAAPLNSVVGSNSVTSFVISNILFPSWNGLTDIDWTKTTNWDLETVPNSTSNVTIPTGTPNQPTIATDVAINSLAIATGASLTAIGTNLTVTGAIANSGTMTLANNSNLIQGGTTNANTGNITVKRNSTLLSRLDYTIWSSPVTNSSQFLTTFSPLTSTNRFYNYNEATNVYNVIPSPSTTSFSLASGYFIRMPNTAVTAPATETFIGVFTGVPNNGDITKAVTYNGTAPFGYNMVGNPYPSTISADAFIAANATKIESSLYFWRKINGASGSAYAVYNSMGATKTPSSAIPNGIIQVGQGFLVKAKSTSSLIFNNTMRVANNSNQFFKTKQLVEKDRVWLNLTNNSGVFSQALIGYTTDATLGVDIYDAKYINDSPTAFTSNINNEEYTIQGRPSFDVSDVVPLNFKTDVAGDYTIAIDLAEGLLAATQEVYLVDNKMEAETNLKTGPYTFSAIAGVDNNRFSLKYQKTLKVDGRAFDENSVNVFRNNGSLFVNSQSVSLNEIQVFDIQGRFLAALKNVNATTAVIKDLKAAHQVLIVKISDQNNNVISKKVLN